MTRMHVGTVRHNILQSEFVGRSEFFEVQTKRVRGRTRAARRKRALGQQYLADGQKRALKEDLLTDCLLDDEVVGSFDPHQLRRLITGK